MKSEYEYILSARDQLGDHLGQWIAVVGEEIVSTGDDAKKVIKKPGKSILTGHRSL